VTPPYDMTAVVASHKRASSFIGVTRSDVLVVFLTPEGDNTVTFQGAVSGGAGFPNPPDYSAQLSLVTDHVTRRKPFDPQGPSYDVSFSYPGPSASDATLSLLQWKRDASGLPAEYAGHVQKSLTIAGSGTFAVALPLASVTARSVTGSITAPAGFDQLSSSLLVGGFVPFSGAALASTSYGFVIPQGLTPLPVLAVSAAAPDGSAVGLSQQLADTTLQQDYDLPDGATLETPADAATGITDSTPFTFTPGFAGVYLFAFQVGDWDIRVHSEQPSATLPPGVPLPADADGTWQVLGESGSMDALVSPIPVLPAQTRDFSSVLRTFHTAP
jgi:hypothetical protein